MDSELKILTAELMHIPPEQLPDLFKKIKQVVQGTHSVVQILDPEEKKERKGRPNLKKPFSSTKRDPSAFELVEKELEDAKKVARKRTGRPLQQGPSKKRKTMSYLDLEAEGSHDEEEKTSEEEEEEEEDHDFIVNSPVKSEEDGLDGNIPNLVSFDVMQFTSHFP